MGTNKIDHINIALMGVSDVFASVIPFQLFLFAYAVLGPLHYLTEISWLKGKGYFTGSKYDRAFLIGSGIALFLLGVIPSADAIMFKLLLWIFCAALIMTLSISTAKKYAWIAVIGLPLLLMAELPRSLSLFAVFLPTLTHVYVFTGCFMLYGALKARSVSGYAAFLAYLIIPAGLVLLSLRGGVSAASAYIENAYAFMAPVNQALLSLIGTGGSDLSATIFFSAAGIAVMKFIAFAYTYHYLNWFSKTKVIKWHLVPKDHLAIILILWLGAVGLYLYNYELGIFILAFLSMLHVLLEFPLNHRTFYGIGVELRARCLAWSAARA